MRAVRLRHQLDDANALGTSAAYRDTSLGRSGGSGHGRHIGVRVEDTAWTGSAAGRGVGGTTRRRRRPFPKTTKSRVLLLLLLSFLFIGSLTVIINRYLSEVAGDLKRYEMEHERRWYTPWRRPSFRRDGAWDVRDPSAMLGFRVVPPHSRPVYTPEALQQRYGNMDLVYTFVNGTESNHAFRRQLIEECGRRLFLVHKLRLLQMPSASLVLDECPFTNGASRTNGELIAEVRRQIDLHYHGSDVTAMVSRDWESDELRHSFRSVEAHMQWHTGRVVVVSPGHHAQWVDGAKNFLASRCGAAAAARRTSAGGRHTQPHVRVTTVHQDAVLPYGMRLTLNSHTVEKYLWRVRNLTSVHLYFNDDYFVNRDTAITDFLNPFGGTIIRTEQHPIKEVKRASLNNPHSWDDSVSHTTLFTTMEVDIHPENHLSSALVTLWHTRNVAHVNPRAGTVGFSDVALVEAPPLERTLDLAAVHKPDTLPPTLSLDARVAASGSDPANPHGRPVTPQHVAAHAPFTYCTNMLRFFAVRYAPEFIEQMTASLDRSSIDLLIPFMYNAFMMGRPWAASPAYMRYLAYMHKYSDAVESNARYAQQQRLTQSTSDTASLATTRTTTTVPPVSTTPLPGWEFPPRVDVVLDNEDGCAPATHLAGFSQTGSLFTAAVDNPDELKRSFERVRRKNPLFFNINGAFSKEKTRVLMKEKLTELFPHPSYLEGDAVAAKDQTRDDDATGLRPLYAQLMGLPLVLLTSYAHGACPLVRSLQLSLADHRGPVWVVVHRSAVGEDVAANATVLPDETLSEARRRLRHRVYNAMPVLRCTFRPDAVSVVTVDSNASLWAEMRRVVGEGDAGAARAGVVLPDSCRSGGRGCAGGRRVRGFVVDARARRVPPADYMDLVHALTMPGQTLALEDLTAVPLHGAGAEAAAETLASDDVLLSVSVAEAESSGVHWIFGASESDLLLTYPLPVEKYEDMSAKLRWLNKDPHWENTVDAEDKD